MSIYLFILVNVNITSQKKKKKKDDLHKRKYCFTLINDTVI